MDDFILQNKSLKGSQSAFFTANDETMAMKKNLVTRGKGL
jgi:hypothetical protein